MMSGTEVELYQAIFQFQCANWIGLQSPRLQSLLKHFSLAMSKMIIGNLAMTNPSPFSSWRLQLALRQSPTRPIRRSLVAVRHTPLTLTLPWRLVIDLLGFGRVVRNGGEWTPYLHGNSRVLQGTVVPSHIIGGIDGREDSVFVLVQADKEDGCLFFKKKNPNQNVRAAWERLPKKD